MKPEVVLLVAILAIVAFVAYQATSARAQPGTSAGGSRLADAVSRAASGGSRPDVTGSGVGAGLGAMAGGSV